MYFDDDDDDLAGAFADDDDGDPADADDDDDLDDAVADGYGNELSTIRGALATFANASDWEDDDDDRDAYYTSPIDDEDELLHFRDALAAAQRRGETALLNGLPADVQTKLAALSAEAEKRAAAPIVQVG